MDYPECKAGIGSSALEVYSLCFASTTVQVFPSENVLAPTVSASKYLFFSLIVTVNFNVKVHQVINGTVLHILLVILLVMFSFKVGEAVCV